MNPATLRRRAQLLKQVEEGRVIAGNLLDIDSVITAYSNPYYDAMKSRIPNKRITEICPYCGQFISTYERCNNCGCYPADRLWLNDMNRTYHRRGKL